MTRYTYKTTITVTVDMADEGEEWDEGDVAHWDTPAEQEESALLYAEQAMPLEPTYEEPFVTIDIPPLKLVEGGTE